MKFSLQGAETKILRLSSGKKTRAAPSSIPIPLFSKKIARGHSWDGAVLLQVLGVGKVECPLSHFFYGQFMGDRERGRAITKRSIRGASQSSQELLSGIHGAGAKQGP